MINRRTLLAGAGAAASLLATGCKPGTANPTSQQTYVLVHGAWHGGWCWRDVRTILEAAGHKVFTPTLAGLGERAHLMSPDIGLETHIKDVTDLIEEGDLTDIILVGHSYGGMVITGVVDRLKDRIAHIVYLDAGVPDDGENFASQSPGKSPKEIAEAEAQFKTLAKDGVAMDVFPATFLGIPETDTENIEWVSKNMTPHPLKTWLDPISLQNGGSAGVPRTYIHCIEPALSGSSFAAHFDIFKDDKSWNAVTLATGHDAMVTAPNELSEILLSI